MPPVCYFCGSGYKEQGNTNVCTRVLDLQKKVDTITAQINNSCDSLESLLKRFPTRELSNFYVTEIVNLCVRRLRDVLK